MKNMANKNKHQIRSTNQVVSSDKTLKILANSIYKSLKDEGCQHKDIIGVSSQLIGLVTKAMDEKKKP